MYPIVRIDPSHAVNLEQLGTKRKYWIRRENQRVLFKAEERGTGEDWAEKVACELAREIGLPHVHYDLAEEIGSLTPGVACVTCAPPPAQLVMGNQILLALDDAYPAEGGTKYRVKAHTIDAVASAVQLLKPPPPEWMTSVPEGIETSLDVFVGYIMLDAWIANQDRHHENWAALWTGDRLALAPSFDHGAALARNLTDESRKMRLATSDTRAQVPAFARKARSAFFAAEDQSRPLSTHDAWHGFARCQPDAARRWLARLESVDVSTMDGVLSQIPPKRMSAICRQFTLKLLQENHQILVSESS